jgi:hypothetical protein
MQILEGKKGNEINEILKMKKRIIKGKRFRNLDDDDNYAQMKDGISWHRELPAGQGSPSVFG